MCLSFIWTIISCLRFFFDQSLCYIYQLINMMFDANATFFLLGHCSHALNTFNAFLHGIINVLKQTSYTQTRTSITQHALHAPTHREEPRIPEHQRILKPICSVVQKEKKTKSKSDARAISICPPHARACHFQWDMKTFDGSL